MGVLPTGEAATTALSDGRLLGRVAQGDAKAFEVLYERCATRVYSAIRCVITDVAVAEEVALAVWSQVWRTAAGHDPARCGAVEWVVAQARRGAVDRLRSAQAAPRGAVVFPVVAAGSTWRVAEEQRQVLSLACHGGQTFREIGAALDVELPTVRRWMREGVMAMAKHFDVTT